MSLPPLSLDTPETDPLNKKGRPLKGAARGVSEAAGHLRGRTATALVAKAAEHQQAAQNLFTSMGPSSSTDRFQERHMRLTTIRAPTAEESRCLAAAELIRGVKPRSLFDDVDEIKAGTASRLTQCPSESCHTCVTKIGERVLGLHKLERALGTPETTAPQRLLNWVDEDCGRLYAGQTHGAS